MGDLWETLWWLAYTTEHLAADNKYLNGLPSDIQNHLIAIGEWIVGLLKGWG